MAHETRFRIKAGDLILELEGTEEFVTAQLNRKRDEVEAILAEQLKLMRSGKFGVVRVTSGRRGRPPKEGGPRRGGTGRRPGRQPVIIRESELELKPRALAALRRYLEELASTAKLGKDAAVFGTAYFLCTQVLKRDVFTAGDVMAAYAQLGRLPFAPLAASVDVVQMLRNLAAASIGKEWVARNSDGTFALTARGRQVAEAGKIVRPRGRRPGKPARGTNAKSAERRGKKKK